MNPHTVNFSSPDTYVSGVPYEAFRTLRQEEPVARRSEPDAGTYWAITGHHPAVTVLRNPTLYSSWRSGALIVDPPPPMLDKMREGLLHRDPPDHTHLRRLMNRAFTPRRVAELELCIARHAESLISRLLGRAACDFATEVAELPVFVICEILGVPLEDREKLTGWMERLIENPVADREAATRDVRAAVMEMRAYAGELCRKKRSMPSSDLLSELLQIQEGGQRLSDGELEALFVLLFNAGSDTTRSLLCFGLDRLLEHPESLHGLRADATLLPTAIEEMLRYDSPLLQVRRTATQDTDLAGKRIAEGDKVVVFLPAANRDESVFSDPDRFDIRRAPNDHLAFGFATHFCLGAPLARAEARHVFQRLLARTTDIERAGPLVLSRSNFARGVRHLEIRYRLR